MKFLFVTIVAILINLQMDSNLLANEKKSTVPSIIFNGRIVFQKSDDKIGQIFVLDGKDSKLIRLTSVGHNYQPKWSPDGKNIAFASNRKGHRWEIYIMDSDSKNQRRVTYTTDGFSTQPRWESSGNELYFSSNIKGDIRENLVNLKTGEVKIIASTGKIPAVKAIPIKDIIKDIDKIEDEQLKKMTEALEKETKEILERLQGRFKIFPSPDGKHLLIHYSSGKIVLVDKKSKKEKTLDDGSEPAWSKDGNKLAYFIASDELKDTLVVWDVDKGIQEKKAVPTKKYYEECFSTSWSRDSKQIVYTCGPVAGPEEPWLYLYDLKTKQSVKLIQGSNPDWY